MAATTQHAKTHTRQIHLNIETVQMDYFTVRVKLSEAGGYNSVETGWAYLAARGNHGRDSRPMRNPNGHPRPNGIYSSNMSKPFKHSEKNSDFKLE